MKSLIHIKRSFLIIGTLYAIIYSSPLQANTAEEDLLKKTEEFRLVLLTKQKVTWVKKDQIELKLPSKEKPVNPDSSDFVLTQTRMRQNIGLIQKAGVQASPARQRILARVTVYWANGPDTDPWSAKNISSTQTPLVRLHHAAVDPKIIPYGSKLIVEYKGGRIAVQAVDTGGAVKNKTASKKSGETPEEQNAPVVDLFFQTREEALAYANTHPPFQWVEVIPPKRRM